MCSETTVGGFLGRSPLSAEFFEKSLDRANALLVLCSTGGKPVLGAEDLNGEDVDPGVLSKTEPTSWAFLVEVFGMTLVVGVLGVWWWVDEEDQRARVKSRVKSTSAPSCIGREININP